MKESVNSWIIRDDKNTIHNLRRRNKEGVIKHDVGRFHVYVCKKCNRVYEQNPFLNEGARVYYYKDFPTYKLERRTCDSCNGHTWVYGHIKTFSTGKERFTKKTRYNGRNTSFISANNRQ